MTKETAALLVDFCNHLLSRAMLFDNAWMLSKVT
jgi:hypothetical protein